MPGLVRPVRYFEIGNEVDSSNLAHSHGLTAQNYVANRLIPAYRAAKAASADAVVLNAGLAMEGNPAFNTDYMNTMLDLIEAAGGASENYFFDIFAFHYYFDLQNPEYFYDNVQLVKDQLAARALAAKPMWLTEFGAATKNDEGGQIREVDQASLLLRYQAMIGLHGIDRSFIYSLKDQNSGSGDWEGEYGIFKVVCDGTTEQVIEKSAVNVLTHFFAATAGMTAQGINPATERDQGHPPRHIQ